MTDTQAPFAAVSPENPASAITLPARAELFLETHRVQGVIDQGTEPRRLVDVLNAISGPLALVHEAYLRPLDGEREAGSRFEVVQLRRDAILLAVPITDVLHSSSTPEILPRKAVPATFVLPGLVVTGHLHLPPEADARVVRLVGRESFVPVTDARIERVGYAAGTRQERVVVVNLDRVQLYAPD